jgi:pantetheine-phosphate adenylyltransferase
VLVVVNDAKQPASTESERAIQVRWKLPATWDNSPSPRAWADRRVLTAARRRRDHPRGVRNRSDLRHDHQLAAMNEALGITTLLLLANSGLAAMSSTVLRGLGI